MTKFEEKVRDLINYHHSESVGDLNTIVKEESKILYNIAKEEMIEKSFAAMREIYERYGHIPENCKEEFEQIIRRNHE